MITCDLLTGFLGSGKTTLLNAFLRLEAGADTAVIVNEFGTIGLDQLLYKEVSEDVYLLDSGCLCCTVTHSLRETLLEIKNLTARMGRPPLRRVVIETTGLADPLPILHALLGDRTLTPDFRLGQVITTVDAVQGAAQLEQHQESRRQASVAEHLVITKTDLADNARLPALRQKLFRINPRAQVSESVSGQAALSVFDGDGYDRSLQLLAPGGDYIRRESTTQNYFTIPDQTGTPAHDSAIGSWSTFIDTQPTWAGVSAWWNLLIHKFGDRLLRCKGLLHMDDVRPFVLIQGVGKVFHSPAFLTQWPDADPRSRIVCIGAGLDESWLRDSLRALLITEASSRPLTLNELNDCF
ncbi:MAG: GTP-binding protein [Pseudomonadota bacterium]